ncbi:MAG: hypothetical protein H6606_10395 [Flavobacteriales bacterium]|nr:hypothetical protein [Flavobacteriales bacterium]
MKWYIAFLIPLASIPILLIISLRSVAVWKNKVLLNAENPKEVLGRARRSFLKSNYLERFTIWTPGQHVSFQDAYESRMREVRKGMLEHGAELYDGRKKLHIHTAMGVVPAWLLISVSGIVATLVWFRYRPDVTERVVAALLFLSFLFLAVAMIRSFLKRNKDIILLDRHGIRVDGTHYPWQDLMLVDVDAGQDLVLKLRNGETQRRSVRGLSLSPAEIEEAALYFKDLLDREALEKA